MNRPAGSGFIALLPLPRWPWPGAPRWRTSRRNPEKEKTRKGTGYGAAAGAVVGLLSAGNSLFKSAMIGAAAGALVGGSAGNYMDKQEAKLRAADGGHRRRRRAQGRQHHARHAGQRDVRVRQRGPEPAVLSGARQGCRRRWSSTTRPSSRSPDTPTASAAMRTTSSCRSGAPTAWRPTCRAAACRQARVVTVGAGEDHPVASNETEDGRAQNRRVEITIVPVTEEERGEGEAGLREWGHSPISGWK